MNAAMEKMRKDLCEEYGLFVAIHHHQGYLGHLTSDLGDALAQMYQTEMLDTVDSWIADRSHKHGMSAEQLCQSIEANVNEHAAVLQRFRDQYKGTQLMNIIRSFAVKHMAYHGDLYPFLEQKAAIFYVRHFVKGK